MTNTTLFDRWVAALRSDKYSKGRRRMRDEGDFYCCLGVLCDVSGKGQWTESKGIQGHYEYYIAGESSNDLYLPQSVIDALRTHLDPDARYGLDDDAWDEYLAYLNDVECWPFEKIADWLEEHRIQETL